MEIERKYDMDHLPGDLSSYQSKKIEQGYLCHNPTIRIRKCNDDYILTYKSRSGIMRSLKSSVIINDEVELMLSMEAYGELRAKIDGNLISKTRYMIPLSQGLTAELDIFEGRLQGLIIVEVEFPDETTAEEFIPPEWFGKERSADKRFSNYYLSKLSGLEELGKQE